MSSLGISGLVVSWLILIGLIPIAVLANPLRPKLLLGARILFYTAATIVFWITGLFLVALITNVSSIEYVLRHILPTTPFLYRVAALWAGREGVFLFWTTLILISLMICSLRIQNTSFQSQRNFIIVSAIITTIWLTAVIFKFDPFRPAISYETVRPFLNPHLRSWPMLLHPPLTYISLAGICVLFALIFTDLRESSIRQSFILWVRISLSFLTAGILLGAIWAYKEISWSNYWSWDPIESLSFISWLILLSLLQLQERTDKVGKISVFLAGLSFSFMLFTSYVIRSSILTSLHSHADPNRFDIMLGGATLAIVITLILAYRTSSVESIPKDTGLIVSTIVLLAATILAFTTSPIFLEKKAPTGFYNKAVAIAAIAIMWILFSQNIRLLKDPTYRKQVVFAGITIGSVFVFLVWYLTNIEELILLIAIFTMIQLIISQVFSFNYYKERRYLCLRNIGLVVLAFGVIWSINNTDRYSVNIKTSKDQFTKLTDTLSIKYLGINAKEEKGNLVITSSFIVKIDGKRYNLSPKYVLYEFNNGRLIPAIKQTLLYDIYLSTDAPLTAEEKPINITISRVWFIKLVWLGPIFLIASFILPEISPYNRRLYGKPER